MVRLFGPPVGQCKISFEAKHSFFKRIIRHTRCYKNATLTLASKHQMMIAYYQSAPCLTTSNLEVSAVSTLPVDLLKDEIAENITKRFSDISEVHLAKYVTSKVITYRKGM